MNHSSEAGMVMRCVLISMVLAMAACGSSASEDTDSSVPVPDSGNVDAAFVFDAAVPDAAPTADAFVATGDHHQFVINTITIPTSSAEATMCGLNIDGDVQNRVDNALGQIIAVLASNAGADPQTVMDQALADGSALHLLDVQADSLADDPSVAMRPFFGDDTDGNPADNFSGSEMFDISASSPMNDLVPGAIVTGGLDLGPGEMSVRIVLFGGAPPVAVPLVGVRTTGGITATNISNGILGGAITQDTIDNILLPAVTLGMQTLVAQDCGGTFPNCCTDGSNGQTVVALFDENDDCTVSQSEVENNNLVMSLLAPDVDLFDASGNFNPGADGVKDSLSLGVCFTAVGAQFSLP